MKKANKLVVILFIYRGIIQTISTVSMIKFAKSFINFDIYLRFRLKTETCVLEEKIGVR